MQILKPNDMTIQQKYRALSILLTWLFFALLLFIFLLGPVHTLYKNGGSTYLSSFCFFGFFLGYSFTAYRIGLPLRCYGLIKPTAHSIFKIIIISFLFCIVAFVIKAVIIQTISDDHQYPLIMILAPNADVKTLLLYVVFYTLACPFQAMIFHSFTQGPLTDLLDIRWRAFITITL